MGTKSDNQIKFDKILGNNLKKLRSNLALSQDDMSKQMGLKRQHYGKLEGGINTPNIFLLYQAFSEQGSDLCKFLSCVIEEYEVKSKAQSMAADKKAATQYFQNAVKNKAKSSKD